MKQSIEKKLTRIAWIFLPIFIGCTEVGSHSNEFIKKPILLTSIFLSFLCISYILCQIILFWKNRKSRSKTKKSFLKVLGVSCIFIEWLGAITFLCVLYAPFSTFRSWLIPTAMTTMNHRYFATWFYSQKEIEEVLNENKLIEQEEDTNPDLIQIENEEPITYENEYERQVLEKENQDDVYKIIPISGKKYKGYLAVIYDPSRISVGVTKYLEKRGQYVTEMASQEKALLAINGGGFVDPGYNSSGGSPQGVLIKNNKVLSSKKYDIAGGLIGFTKDNKLVLARITSKEAINRGIRDAVSFGPFLIVNGKKSFIKGNGGWGTAPRTAIAQRKDGIVLMLVLDGRQIKKPGASMVDLTNILDKYGAVNAANLDGGTSTVMVLPKEEAKKYLDADELEGHCRKEYCQINDPVDSTGAHKTRPIASSFIVK